MVSDHVEAVGKGEVAPPARWRRRGIRLSAGHLLVALAAVVAFVANLAVLRGQDETVAVLVAAHDLPSGATLDRSDLRPEPVPTGAAGLGSFIVASDLDGIDGMVVTRPVPAGAPLAQRDLRPPAAPADLRAMSIPVERERAVGGSLSVGDRVDVVHVSEQGPLFVLSGAEVLDVASGDSSALGSSGRFWVTVGVDAKGALRLAAALADGGVDVIRSTGAEEVSPVEQITVEEP